MLKRLLTATLAVLSLTTLAAQAPLPGEDWVPLFNGKDLTGWVEVGKEKWSVENGIIHGQREGL